jgi:UDP-GlcNAc:undecaprenyl-phosphate/decaprenyl-phosphate GlcNAc-1-phosphate transferase
MTLNLAIAITAFIIAFLIFPVIIKYAIQQNLVDTPGRRKIHTKETPSLGGIGLFAGFLVAVFVWLDFNDWADIKYRLSALGLIFFLGVRDDLVPLKAIYKLTGQIIAALIIVHLADIRLHSLYGLFGSHQEFPLWLSYGISVFTLIIIINSFNLIDGLDGLAATLAIISLLFFGLWFFYTGNPMFAMLAFAMLGGLIAFLIYNWEPADIFMGDTGALLLGLLMGTMAIQFIDTNYHLSVNDPFKFGASVTAGICIIIIPLIDTARIIILRLLKGQSPLNPDKSHIHHSLLRMGLGHSKSVIVLGLTHISFLALLLVFQDAPDKYLLPGIVFYAIGLSILLDRLIISRLNHRSPQ